MLVVYSRLFVFSKKFGRKKIISSLVVFSRFLVVHSHIPIFSFLKCVILYRALVHIITHLYYHTKIHKYTKNTKNHYNHKNSLSIENNEFKFFLWNICIGLVWLVGYSKPKMYHMSTSFLVLLSCVSFLT